MLTDFGRREAPSVPYVHYLLKKMKEIGILIDKQKREKPKTVLTSENIAAVAESFAQRPWYDAIQRPIGSRVETN